MENFKDQRLFEIIFSDADVVDLDFSEWDKLVRLIVVADHMPFDGENSRPIYCVEFVQCSLFEMTISKFISGLGDDKHCQWNIHDFSLTMSNGKFDIKFESSVAGPDISVKCANIIIDEIDSGILKMVNSSWDKPYAPLARPSVFDLYRSLLNKRKPMD